MSTAAATERQISYLADLRNKTVSAIHRDDPTFVLMYRSEDAATYLRNLDASKAGRCWATATFMGSDERMTIVNSVRDGILTTEDAKAQLPAAWAAWVERVASALTCNIAELTKDEASEQINLLK